MHPFAEPGGTRLWNSWGPNAGATSARSRTSRRGKRCPVAIGRMLGIDDLRGRILAQALGVPARAQHLLRLTLTQPDGALVDGYSIVVGALS